MPERRYFLGRKHDQGIHEIIILIPPINTNHMKPERNRNPNQNRYFPLSLHPPKPHTQTNTLNKQHNSHIHPKNIILLRDHTKNKHHTFNAVCFLRISFDLKSTAAIQIVTKNPAFTPQHHQIKQKRASNRTVTQNVPCKCCLMKTTKRSNENGKTCSIHLAACWMSYLW